MIYPTLRATIRKGKIQLLDEFQLPEDALLLVTIIDETVVEKLSLGERLAGSLQDILLGRVTEVSSPESLSAHLDKVLSEA